MFQVKICGITQPDDAHQAAEAGADAVGLNFYPPSSRFVEPEQAKKIAAAVPLGVMKVGLFVNTEAEQIVDCYERLKLDAIQLHGDEPPEFLGQLGQRPIVKAFRCGADGLAPVAEYLDRCRKVGHLPQAALIDAHQSGSYGGTGKTVDWSLLADVREVLKGLPFILAGGLTADNVATAIAAVHPDGVDTASGVESQAGIKDADKVCAFVTAARAALKK